MKSTHSSFYFLMSKSAFFHVVFASISMLRNGACCAEKCGLIVLFAIDERCATCCTDLCNKMTIFKDDVLVHIMCTAQESGFR